ncbi:MAG TPA: Hsp70 family protein [Gemmataceae bacterium]|nr:Hsp70 family protein [Gemmataceae bacterium]
MPTPIQSAGSGPKVRKTVGIDLGTTNSVIALLDAADSALLTGADDQGRMTFPSVLGWHAGLGRLVAGRPARDLRAPGWGMVVPPGWGTVSDPAPTPTLPLSSVKRFMGLDKQFTLGSETLSPPQASAVILRSLRDLLARTLNDSNYLLDSAVITMPAYFNHNQIEATRQAGELAGYDVVELLHEPTAAAIYYSWIENHGDAVYLVYDLGGGTFDVSIIRRRLGDHEVLSVSGDPFLGGDDFDRLLATHLIEHGTWTIEGGDTTSPAALFDPSTPAGAVHFGRLVHVAEGIKIALTDSERVKRYVPSLTFTQDGKALALETTVERAAFNGIIRQKVDRTIDCCRDALARARARAGIRLSDVDYVVLVGGSSRVPLVRETVRAALCNPELPDHVRTLEPLLHEPDLCVAYGAALRAAGHGTRYLFQGSGVRGQGSGDKVLELHVASPANTPDPKYQLTGVVRIGAASTDPCPLTPDPFLEGASVRIRSLATGLTEEVFLDERGSFAQDLVLQRETVNVLELAVCDGEAREVARVVVPVRCQEAGRALGRGVLPTQIIAKPLQIEVLNRSGQRVKQVVAPIGATLPGAFQLTCRTHDQAGRIVVPIFEENRVVKQMVVSDLDPNLPVGSPVEVEFAIDVKHNIEVRVRVRQSGGRERTESAVIEAAAPARRPTRADIDEALGMIDELLPQFSGGFRTRIRSKATQLHQDLLEALRYDDEPKAVQRMAEMRELLQSLESSRGQGLDPPWPRFAQLVRRCLDLAAEAAQATGRDRNELFEHVHAQERYGEQAYEEQNQALYRECRENLEKYVGYLDQLLRDALPRPAEPTPQLSPEEEARNVLDRFRNYLTAVWKQVRAKQRGDLEPRLTEIAALARGLSQRMKTEANAVIREARRLGAEVHKIEEFLQNGRRQPTGDDAGLLEGTA